MADTEMKWYVMRAVSGKESKVKEYIDAEIKKAALVGEIPVLLRNTPNVFGFLGESNSNPTPLRQSEVNRLLGAVDEMQDVPEEVLIPYAEGETVKVTEGPFSGFSAVIEEVNNEKKKLKVMVKIFGRKTPLELGFMQVEKE